MVQYYNIQIVNTNISKISLVRKSRKAIVETISKQLEYVTKGHIATQIILFLNLKWLYSEVMAIQY